MPEVIPDKYKEWNGTRVKTDDNPGLSTKTLNVFWEAVRPDPNSELYNPLNWESGHADMPRTYFQACGADLQRDDTLIYERVLRTEYSIETKLDIYPGLPHVFWFFYPELSACKKFMEDRKRGLGWLLGLI